MAGGQVGKFWGLMNFEHEMIESLVIRSNPFVRAVPAITLSCNSGISLISIVSTTKLFFIRI